VTALPTGPGVACSALRVRRLEAGELAGVERSRTEAHVASCARCQETARALADERRALQAALPFEAFAAGVAERLADGVARPRRWWPPVLAYAAAAVLAVALALPLLGRPGRPPADDAGWRAKGRVELGVYAKDASGVRVLSPGEPVPRGAALQVGLPAGAGRAHAAVALVDGDGPAIIYAGPASAGLLGGAFEWTGDGDGALVLVLSDAPIDPAALAERLRRGGPDGVGGPGAEVLVRPLRRESP
jgi:hypothetical protein